MEANSAPHSVMHDGLKMKVMSFAQQQKNKNDASRCDETNKPSSQKARPSFTSF